MAEPIKPVLQPPPAFRNPNTPPNSAPIKRPKLPPTYAAKQRRSRGCCCCCCCIFLSLLFFFLFLVLIAGGVFYIWYQPRLPTFHLHSLKFPRFNVTVKPDGTYLDSHTLIRFRVANPNSKIAVNYGETNVQLGIGEEPDDVDLGSASLPGIMLGKKNTTILSIETQVRHSLINDGVGKRLKGEFQRKEIEVNVEVKTIVGFRVDSLKLDKIPVQVLCGGVSWKELEAGDTPKCTLNVLKWINIH